MFGLKLFAKVKTRKFASEKERRQYFAIQDYYRKKGESPKPMVSKPKTKGK